MRDPCVAVEEFTKAKVKGGPTIVFYNASKDGVSDVAVDCRDFNAVYVEAYANGTNPSATLQILGSGASGGIYLPVPDPNGLQVVTKNLPFNVITGAGWVKAELSGTSGTFTVQITPFVSPGATQINVSEVLSAGSYTNAATTTASIGNTSTLALAANANRRYALLMNNSDTDIYLTIGAAAVVGQGILLLSPAGAYEMSPKFGNLVSAAIYAVHGGTGNKSLLVTEGT